MRNFWRNKSVLVTGGAGFIGSHLVESLVKRGALVTVPIKPGEDKTDFLKNVRSKIQIKFGDLKNFNNCLRFSAHQNIVMNLAAKLGGIEYNIKHPGSLFYENMQIFMNMLEAARKNKVKRFLVVSSACVYSRFCTIPTPEEEGFRDSPEPTNEGYGWAKRMSEFLAQAYAKEYKMEIAIARPYNAYGPRDNFNVSSSHVIPSLIKRVFSGGNPLKVWGDGEQSRSFLYVNDFVMALLKITENYAVADPLNIGSYQEIKIKDLAKLIVKLSGKKLKIVFDKTKPIGQSRRQGGIKNVKEKIGFEAKTTLEEGLKKTIKWYKKNFRL